MAQITNGIRAILSIPCVYGLWEVLAGGKKVRRRFVERYMQLQSSDAVFDIGCGTGTIFEVLPEGIEYTGFDLSEEYIANAREQFGDRATFLHADVGETPEVPENHFDLAIALGILHHLEDDESVKLFEQAWKALKPGGRLVTLDGVYDDKQSRLARWVVSKDRGRNIRDQEGYERLAREYFDSVESEIRHDMIRIPYTHIVMTCRK